MHVRFPYKAQAQTSDLIVSYHRYLPSMLLVFNVHNSKSWLYVCKFISYFQSLMDVQPRWQIDVYQQNMFRRGCNKAKNNIPNQEFVFFRIHGFKKKSNIFVRRSDFHSRCKPVFPSSWMETDFCFEIARLTVFCWRCEEVEMRGICLEAQKLIQTKVVITLKNCTSIQRTPSRGIDLRDFSIFEGMKKFYNRYSAKKCTKYPFDSRAHHKHCTVYCSRRPIASKPGSSALKQYSLNNTRDNQDLMQPALVPPLIVLTSALSRSFRRKGQDKVQKMIVWGQIALDYGWHVILSRLGRSGGDDPGLEAIGGREP